MVAIIYKDLSFEIVGLAMQVHQQLGYGSLDKVQENALAILLRREGLRVQTQELLTVLFEAEEVDQFFADMLIEDKVSLELKAAERISSAHKSRALNYLDATGLKLAISINYGPKKPESYQFVN